MVERRKFAVFCWTFRSPDRERLKEDTPIEIACELSLSIRAQYEGAVQRARLEGGEVVGTFVFEESAHYMSPRGAEVLARAISWCLANEACLILPDFEKVRHSGPYAGYLVEFGASLRAIEPLPTMAHDPHGQVLAHFQKHEKRQRISKGVKAAVRAGAKLGFAADTQESKSAGQLGRQTQRIKAVSRATAVVQLVDDLRRQKPEITLNSLADELNAALATMPDLKPSRSHKWTAAALRMLLKRHQERIDEQNDANHGLI